MNVVGKVALMDMLSSLRTGMFNGCKMRLFTNNITIGADTVLGDFVEATFDGYSSATIATWNTPYVDDAGNATMLAPLQQWMCTGDTTPESVVGVYLEHGTSPSNKLLYAERFDGQVDMMKNGDALPYVPSFTLGPTG